MRVEEASGDPEPAAEIGLYTVANSAENLGQWLTNYRKLLGVFGVVTFAILFISLSMIVDSGDLETISRWRVFLVILMGAPACILLCKYGDQKIYLPRTKIPYLSKVWPDSVKLPHLVWLLFTCGLLITNMMLGGVGEEGDIECSKEKWHPMIQPLGDLYLTPIFGSGLDIKERIRNMFGAFLFVDFIGSFTGPTYPDKVLPTIDKRMHQKDLDERFWYFIPRYCILFITSFGFFEFMWYVCSEWLMVKNQVAKWRKSTWYVWSMAQDRISSLRKRPKSAQSSLEEPILQAPEHTQNSLDKPIQGVPEQHLLQRQSRSRLTEDDEESEHEFVLKAVRNRRTTLIRSFNAWYVFYQAALHYWTDLIVAGGLMNKQSGTSWEMWSLVFEFSLTVQFVTILVFYALTLGKKHQHPSLLILPAFIPWIGNELHIWKDHASQGLAFALAHCSQDQSLTLSRVGLVLGYAGFLATFCPIYQLLTDDRCHEGLMNAHWPVPMAPKAPKSQGGHWYSKYMPSKKDVMSILIGANTEEKRVRALRGEVYHLLCHELFLYFYGGSILVYLSIMISFVQIAMFPSITIFVKDFVAGWGCSENAAFSYMVNLHIYGDPAPILKLAKDNDWEMLLDAFFDAEAPVPVPAPEPQPMQELAGRADPTVTNLHFFHALVEFEPLDKQNFVEDKLLADGIYGKVMQMHREIEGDLVVVKKMPNSKIDHQKSCESNDRTAHWYPSSGSTEDALTEIGIYQYLSRQQPGCEFICSFLGVFRGDTHTFLALEYCGQELFDIVATGNQIEEPLVRRWIWQLLQATSFLHLHNIGHRDISLENMMLNNDKDRVLRLIDFGQSVRLWVDDAEAIGGKTYLRYFRPVGKDYYRPPEAYLPSSQTIEAECPAGYVSGSVVQVQTSNLLIDVLFPEHATEGGRYTVTPMGYTVVPYDMFSVGVTMFVMHTQNPPWRRAVRSDDIFRFILTNGLAALFEAWRKPLLPPPAMLLLDSLMHCDPARRLDAVQALSSPWFTTQDSAGDTAIGTDVSGPAGSAGD